MSGIRQTRTQKQEAGFSLLELMITGVILVVGILAVAVLFTTAVGNNGRSRLDSTATMLAESVIEQITAALARGGPLSATDCTPTTWTINDAAGGANLSGSGIDFTQTSVPSGYQMLYVVCGAPGVAGTQLTYDVRWNIQQMSVSNPQSSILVTIGARPYGTANNRFTFDLPVTLRTYVGPQ